MATFVIGNRECTYGLSLRGHFLSSDLQNFDEIIPRLLNLFLKPSCEVALDITEALGQGCALPSGERREDGGNVTFFFVVTRNWRCLCSHKSLH